MGDVSVTAVVNPHRAVCGEYAAVVNAGAAHSLVTEGAHVASTADANVVKEQVAYLCAISVCYERST